MFNYFNFQCYDKEEVKFEDVKELMLGEETRRKNQKVGGVGSSALLVESSFLGV